MLSEAAARRVSGSLLGGYRTGALDAPENMPAYNSNHF